MSVKLSQTACTVDVSYYPFDQQTCIVKIGSTDRAIQIGTYEKSINLEQFYMCGKVTNIKLDLNYFKFF